MKKLSLEQLEYGYKKILKLQKEINKTAEKMKKDIEARKAKDEIIKKTTFNDLKPLDLFYVWDDRHKATNITFMARFNEYKKIDNENIEIYYQYPDETKGSLIVSNKILNKDTFRCNTESFRGVLALDFKKYKYQVDKYTFENYGNRNILNNDQSEVWRMDPYHLNFGNNLFKLLYR